MSVFEIISSVGVATVLGAFIYIGRKLQTLDNLHVTTTKIKTNVKVISGYVTSVDFDHT